MKKVGILILATAFGMLSFVACGGSETPSAVTSDGVGMFSDDAAVSVAEIRRQMKAGSEPMTQRIQTEADLYDNQAAISVDVVASGGFKLADLTDKALGHVNQEGDGPYVACLIMAGLTDVIQATETEDALDKILADYEDLLDVLADQEIPTVVCEILPVVAEYDKPSYGMPAAEINTMIGEINQSLYPLALDKAAGFVFAARVLGPRVGMGKGSIVINEANGDNKNGVQPTVEGMRLLCQLYAYGLHKVGYRGGRILVMGDTRVADEALTRKIDQIEFLLPKYLEVELDKTCP